MSDLTDRQEIETQQNFALINFIDEEDKTTKFNNQQKETLNNITTNELVKFIL